MSWLEALIRLATSEAGYRLCKSSLCKELAQRAGVARDLSLSLSMVFAAFAIDVCAHELGEDRCRDLRQRAIEAATSCLDENAARAIMILGIIGDDNLIEFVVSPIINCIMGQLEW
jgi:hypothetical protein